ncbi:MAG: hydrogenase expression/formation protein HypE [Gemmatimonadetes bacterium]|jgi:hydrogenase expression/formation protein HypE|nr:hydrogenase expression/formation protein HypE [Gemmatimonadota bacterium]
MTLATSGLTCPAPIGSNDRVQLGHGSGGKLSAALLRDHFLPRLGNPILDQLGDAAVLSLPTGEIAVSTDTFVVRPLEFPGGNIGALAVHGTVNDLAMMGAEPRYLTLGVVLEEGLPFEVLDRVLAALAEAAAGAGVAIVAGDTKVVERGRADGMYINTTGVGLLHPVVRPAAHRAAPGDAVLVSGAIGRHGMAVMALREGLEFETTITSDTACLWPLVRGLRDAVGPELRVLRDPTRGGLASALNEIAAASRVGIALDEAALPVPTDVGAACEMLGLDPLYVANEGVLVAMVPATLADAALAALQAHPLGAGSRRIGTVVSQHPGMVVLRTALGGTRVVDLLPGDQLPRIC